MADRGKCCVRAGHLKVFSCVGQEVAAPKQRTPHFLCLSIGEATHYLLF